MRYKLYLYSDDDQWGWSIIDEYQDEVAANNEPFATEIEARKDGRAALIDWREQECT